MLPTRIRLRSTISTKTSALTSGQSIETESPNKHLCSRSTAIRPANLTLKQSVAARNSGPTVIRLRMKLKQTPRRTEEHDVARRKLKAAQKKALLSAKAKTMQEWSRKQAQEDIERQVQGYDISQEQEQAPVRRGRGQRAPAQPGVLARPMHPDQQRMIDAFTSPLVNDLDKQYQRRTDAVNAIARHCAVEEAPATRVLEARRPARPVELQQATFEESQPQLRESVIVRPTGPRVERCLICVGKAIALAADDPNISTLCRQFGTDFELGHLRSVQRG